MISGFWLLIRHYFGRLQEKKGLCSFIISALSRLTYLLLHRLLLPTFLLTPSYFPPYSLLLTTSLLTSYYFSPYYSPLSLLTPSLLITFSFPPYSFLLPSLPLTPYYFSPYYSSLLSLLLPRFFFKPIHQPLQLLGDG